MFAYRTSVKFSKPVDFQDEIKMLSENGEDAYTEIAYWRKHPNLHGWMEDLYYKKGGIKCSLIHQVSFLVNQTRMMKL